MAQAIPSAVSRVGPKSVRLDGPHNLAGEPIPANADTLQALSPDLTHSDLLALRKFLELLDRWDCEYHGTKNL